MTRTIRILRFFVSLSNDVRGLLLIVSLLMAPVIVQAADSVTSSAHGPHTVTIVIEAMKFVPETVEVHPGDTVIWTNKDPFPHTVLAQKFGVSSPEIETGKSWKFKVTKPGLIAYICSLHTTMKGTVVVK